jgi:hypothetical protein
MDLALDCFDNLFCVVMPMGLKNQWRKPLMTHSLDRVKRVLQNHYGTWKVELRSVLWDERRRGLPALSLLSKHVVDQSGRGGGGGGV